MFGLREGDFFRKYRNRCFFSYQAKIFGVTIETTLLSDNQSEWLLESMIRANV